jgi:hypothetical protein
LNLDAGFLGFSVMGGLAELVASFQQLLPLAREEFGIEF